MDANKLERANNFEDVVMDYFNDNLNIPLSHYASKHGQYTRGENRQGVEIKNDQKYQTTGNLYISIKRCYANNEYPSGIYRQTETPQLFYVIGCKNNFWVIATKHLRDYYEQNDPLLVNGFTSATNGTEKGFLLKCSVADKMCVHKYSKVKQETLF